MDETDKRLGKAVKTLQESESLYRGLFESLDEAVQICELVFNDDGKPVDVLMLNVNPAFEKHSGLKKDEVVGKRIKSVLSVVEQVWLDCYAKIVREGKSMHFEEYNECIDRWFDVHANPLGGNRFAAVFTDITERKKAEEVLKLRDAQFQAIIENLDEGLVVSDMDGKLIHWNPTAIKMHGFSNIEEGIRKFPEFTEIFELSTMEGNVLSVDQWPAARILRDEHLKDFEVYIRRINNNWERIFNYRGTLVRNAQDQPLMAVITITDITKRKKAEEALMEALYNSQRLTDELKVSNEELKQQGDELLQVNKSLRQSREDMDRAQEVGQIGSWRLDVRRNVLTWSNENHRIFGVPKGTPMTYEMFLEIVHPDDRQYVDTQWNAGLAGEPYDIEHRIVVGTQIKWVREKAYLEFDDEGIVMGGFGITQDITDRKKLEEKLRQARDYLEEQVEERTVEIKKAYQNIKESEEKYRELFNNINDMITLSEIKANGMPGKYIEVNEVGVKRMGYSREEFLNLSPVDIVAPEYRAEMPKNAVVMAEKGSVNFEIVQITKNGKRIPIEVNGHIINYKGRKTYLTVSRDITERKKAEEALKESEEIYRKLLRESFDAWAIHSNGILLAANNTAAKILGGTIEDFIGNPLIDYVYPDYREEVAKRNLRMYKEGGSEPLFEQKFLKLDGTVIDIEAVATSLTYKGKPAVQVVFRDITERKNAEKALKETIQELERSNQELQSFAYITSHDLQEPLRTMGSYAGLLKRRYEGRLDVDADDFLTFMERGAARMKDMVQGLLDYSRVGTQGGEFIEFSAEKALDIALINLKSAIEECHTEITHDSLPDIVADESQITRVFQNLIGNAIKFRKEGVQPKIHISAQKTDNEYIFSVSDNGIGLEEQYTDRIFEVFKRLHAIGEYEGAGIGLAIVKRIINRHHGRIWVKSKLGEGSTFYFTIPIKES